MSVNTRPDTYYLCLGLVWCLLLGDWLLLLLLLPVLLLLLLWEVQTKDR